MVATPDRKGHYKADTALEIERALSSKFIPPTAEVRIGHTWRPLKRMPNKTNKGTRITLPAPESLYAKPTLLQRLHIKKPPLEALIYNPKKDGVLSVIAEGETKR